MISSKLIPFLFLAITGAYAGGLIASAPLLGVAAPVGRSIHPSPLFAAPASLAPLSVPLTRVSPYAPIAFAHSIPQNIPPYASQISIVNRGLFNYPVFPNVYSSPLFNSAPLINSVPFLNAAPYLSSPAFLRSPLAYPVSPAVQTTQLVRGFVPPLAIAPLAPGLQTEAIFRNVPGSAPIPAGDAMVGVDANESAQDDDISSRPTDDETVSEDSADVPDSSNDGDSDSTVVNAAEENPQMSDS